MIYIKFAFWNIHKKDLSREVVDLCSSSGIDILVLCEHENLDENLVKSRLAALNLEYRFEYIDRKSKSIIIRREDIKCRVIQDAYRYSVYKIKLGDFDILLFGIHLPSQLHKTEDELFALSTRIKCEIENIENINGIEKTLIVGDFNMNPFSKGMVDSYGFNAIMCKQTALTLKRKVDHEDVLYFYNPMWRLMGNNEKNVLGSYFHHKNSTSYVWNTFDQVIMRPQLTELFNEDSLKIVSQFGELDLLNNGRPNIRLYSDHLPIIFELREELNI